MICEMKDMKPLQVGKVEYGNLVMCTTNPTHEVIDLSSPSENSCWTKGMSRLKVKILGTATSIAIENGKAVIYYEHI